MQMIQIILDIDKLNEIMKRTVSELLDSVESYTEKMTDKEKESFEKTHSGCLSDLERIMDNLDQADGSCLSLNILMGKNEMRRLSNSVFVEESAKKCGYVQEQLNDSKILLSSEEFKQFAKLIETK